MVWSFVYVAVRQLIALVLWCFRADDQGIPHDRVRNDQVIQHPLDQRFPHAVLR
jgi:hypothetical protein